MRDDSRYQSEKGCEYILSKGYKTHVILFISVAMITVIIYGIWVYITDSKQTGIPSDENFEISLLDAYKIGLLKAKQWDSNAKLYLIASVDGDPGTNQGMDGKRRHWNMVFSVPGSSKSIIYTLHDKSIINTIPSNDRTSNDEVIESLDAINFDSTTIIQKAKKN